MLYKRNKSPVWWVRFSIRGVEIRRSTRTSHRRQAELFEQKLRAEAWEQIELGNAPAPKTHTWDDAVVRWLDETGQRPWRETELSIMRWLSPHLAGIELNKITRELILQLRERKLNEGASNRTANAYAGLICTLLRAACHEWQWIDSAPKVRRLPIATRRIRYLSPDEERRLLAELPDYLQVPVQFALVTGLRHANVVGLQWDQVDLQRRTAWIHADEAKAKKAIGVPLNPTAVVILRGESSKHPSAIFTRNGKPLRQANGTAWRAALKRAGIKDFRWHDLRHTWASRLIQAGVPAHALMELGGWSSAEMVRKYAHFGPDHLREFAERSTLARVPDTERHTDEESA